MPRPARSEAAELLATARAVTERMRQLRAQTFELADAQRALREANRRFADLYDFVPIPYLIVSNLGLITHANEAALRMLGGEREWVTGRPLIGYVEGQDMQKVLNAVLGGTMAAGLSHEVRIRGRKGTRSVQMVARQCRYEAGGRPTYHIALIDLTEVHRLEDERRRADEERQRSQERERVARAASEAKDEFLAMLSHELRTPLTPILAAADALIAHGSLPPPLAVPLDIIRRNVKAEAGLINDLLDVARINRNKLEVTRRPLDLHRLLAELLDAWSGPLAQHRITLEVTLGAPAPWIEGDAARLGQVIRNIIANAVKFSDAGGRIRVATEGRNGRVSLTISDTGSGMTGDQLERLFTPFVHRDDPSPRHGLGLGLVISHAIVEAHEGTLSLRSPGPGQGTIVTVELPTIAAPADATGAAIGIQAGSPGVKAGVSEESLQRAPATDPAPAPASKVLLVEDDPDSAEMLELLLSSEGFEVRTARSVREARALADCCEVLVSDIALPDGSGLDLMREIQARRPMRGVALSGYGSREDVERSGRAGFEEHLTKPVDLEQLVAAVRRLAGQKA